MARLGIRNMCAFIYLLCILLTGSAQATAFVLSSPRDVKVANGTWATFECRVSCTHAFYWYVGSGQSRRLTEVDVNRFVQRNGIQVEVSNANPCTGNGDYTQQLRVLATPELNGTAVQCAAVAIRSAADGVFFSRYAVLKVEPIEPKEPVVATPSTDQPQPDGELPSSPTLSPSPSPVVCPDPSPEISTTTVTVTETPPVLTVTSVLLRTVSATPIPSSIPEPQTNCNGKSSIQTRSVPGRSLPMQEDTATSGQLRLSAFSSSILLLTLLLVTALSHL